MQSNQSNSNSINQFTFLQNHHCQMSDETKKLRENVEGQLNRLLKQLSEIDEGFVRNPPPPPPPLPSHTH